jgi:type II secretory pathway component PulJ
MSASRLFTLFIAISLIVVIAFTAEVAFSSASSIDRESKKRAQREQELDERYGQTP